MKRLRKILPQAIALAFLGVVALALVAASSEPTYEVTLRARGMAFWLDGVDEPNPPLVLPAGRRIELTFVNEDRGLEHDLVLAELDQATRLLPGDGSRQVLDFRAPEEPIDGSYSCTLHPKMMIADLEVR